MGLGKYLVPDVALVPVPSEKAFERTLRWRVSLPRCVQRCSRSHSSALCHWRVLHWQGAGMDAGGYTNGSEEGGGAGKEAEAVLERLCGGGRRVVQSEVSYENSDEVVDDGVDRAVEEAAPGLATDAHYGTVSPSGAAARSAEGRVELGGYRVWISLRDRSKGFSAVP